MSQTTREPAWVMKTGRSLCSHVSSDVRSDECETSMASPSLFMRVTARRPNAVRPPSAVSPRPLPSELASEYAMPICRRPRPYSTSRRSSSFSIGVAASSPNTRPTRPDRYASSMSATVRTVITPLWCARSAWRIPRSVMMSSQRHGACPVTHAVPSIMLSKTTVIPEAARPA